MNINKKPIEKKRLWQKKLEERMDSPVVMGPVLTHCPGVDSCIHIIKFQSVVHK